MKLLTRRNARIGLPVILAALFTLQAAVDWQKPDGFPWLYAFAAVTSLLLAVLYWRIEKQQE